MSFVYSLLEMLYDLTFKSLRENLSFKEELLEELRFIVKFKGSVKPVRRKKTSSTRSSAQASTRDNSPPYNFGPTVITTMHEEDEA